MRIRMLKRNRLFIVCTSLMTLIPIVVGIIMWNELPESMATHFSFSGEADGWSSKYFAVFGISGIVFLVHIFCAFVTAADPNKQNISDKMYRAVLMICPLCSMVVGVAVYAPYVNSDISPLLCVNLLIAVLLIGIGNYLPKCRQNYSIGLRVPWTLSDEENWNKTHRLAGWLWVMAGIVLLINMAFLNIYVTLAAPVSVTIIALAYSYVYHIKHKMHK